MSRFIDSTYSELNRVELKYYLLKKIKELACPRTTDTQKENSLHCTAENSIPIPNFLVRPKHILSAISAQIFRFLWFMPSLGVCSPCFLPTHSYGLFPSKSYSRPKKRRTDRHCRPNLCIKLIDPLNQIALS